MGFDWEGILGADGDDIQSAYDDAIPDDAHDHFYDYDDDEYYDEDGNPISDEEREEIERIEEQCRIYAENKEKEREEMLRQHALIENITFEEGITEIEDSACEGCTKVKSVVIPEGVEIIGSSAFKDCTSLESITIPKSVKKIKESAFCGTPWFNKLIEETSDSSGFVFVNDDILLKYVGNKELITIPNFTNIVADDAFENKSFNKIYLGYNILKQALSNMDTFKKEWKFYDEEDEYDENFQGNYDEYYAALSDYEDLAETKFKDKYFKEYEENNSEVSFGKWLSDKKIYPPYRKHNTHFSFFGASAVCVTVVTDKVTSIDEYAFANIDNLFEIILPKSVAHIGTEAFSDCTKLSDVTVYAESADIANNAFWNCNSLKNVYYVGNDILAKSKNTEHIIYSEKYDCEKKDIAESVSEQVFFEEYKKQENALSSEYKSEYNEYLEKKYGRDFLENPLCDIKPYDNFAYWCSRKGLVVRIYDTTNFFGSKSEKEISPVKSLNTDTYTSYGSNIKIDELLAIKWLPKQLDDLLYPIIPFECDNDKTIPSSEIDIFPFSFDEPFDFGDDCELFNSVENYNDDDLPF